MGFTPAQVNAMSLWEFAACREGWAQAHGGGSAPAAPNDMDLAQLRALGIEGV